MPARAEFRAPLEVAAYSGGFHHSTTMSPQDTLFGHPKGLYVCFLTELWERFSFYGLKALLLLYLVKYHGFGDHDGALLLGTYAGLAYGLPVVGGLIADRYLGMRRAVVLGGALLCLGHLGMAFEGDAARQLADGAIARDQTAIQVMYLSLALIIVGVGFLKPNISTIVGRLYAPDDARRESGFSIFYMGINVGAFASGWVCGELADRFGWGYGFGAAGIGMLLGLVVFLRGQRHFIGLADPPAHRPARIYGLQTDFAILAGALLMVLVIWQLLQARLDVLEAIHLTATEFVAIFASLAVLIWFTRFVLKDCTAAERGRMVVLLILTGTTIIFWGVYEQTYSSWVLYSDRVMNREALGFTWTAAQLTSLGALFVILQTFVFAWLWPRLDRVGRNPSLPMKFAGALVFCGLAFAILWWSASNPSANGLASFWPFVLAYFVLVIGEMMVSPVGLSAVTRLSVPRVVGLMMGVWFLASAFGEMLAGRLATLAAVPTSAGEISDVSAALAVYAELFGKLALVAIAAGVALALAAPALKALMSRPDQPPFAERGAPSGRA